MKITASAVEEICAAIEKVFDIVAYSEALGVSVEQAKSEFLMSLGEARQTLQLLGEFDLQPESRVLEIGAGFGIASAVLAHLGFIVTALEPGGVGFESNQIASRYMSITLPRSINLLSDSAESVCFDDGTKFDLIFSNNVLEHVQDVDKAIKNLLSHLSQTGVMIHSCPNYTFPFEPHFGIPLFPYFPRLTELVLPKSIRKSGLWKSLNFITHGDIRRALRDTEFEVIFRKGTMTKSFSRLKNDEEFTRRHPMLGRIASNQLFFKVIKRALQLPQLFATPMDFVLYRKELSNDPRIKAWVAAT